MLKAFRPRTAIRPSVNWMSSKMAIRRRLSPDHAQEFFPFLKAECPITDDAAANTVWLVHRALLGSQKDTEEIVTAIKKIQKHAKELVSA